MGYIYIDISQDRRKSTRHSKRRGNIIQIRKLSLENTESKVMELKVYFYYFSMLDKIIGTNLIQILRLRIEKRKI